MSFNLAAIGSGEHPTGFFPGKTPLELAMYAIKEALNSAEISKNEIDAILVQATFADGLFGTYMSQCLLAEELGLLGKCKTNIQMSSGGSTASNLILTARGLILTGVAETILLVHVDRLGTGVSLEGSKEIFGREVHDEEWERLYGTNWNIIGSLISHRFMYETGTTVEELASVVVSNRKWAALNPNALLRRTLTVEEVLSSRMVASPQTSRMSNIACDGASAIIVTSAEKARKVTKNPVYLIGAGSIVTHYRLMSEPDLTRMGWEKAGKEAYEKAGVGPEDIDIAELYDSYPVINLMQLESLGFCKRGEAGRFVYEGNTWPGGPLPMDTNGGMLCQGHLGAGGGTSILVETIRQLKGDAGERQVKNAKIAMLTEVGGQYMDAHVLIFQSEVSKK